MSTPEVVPRPAAAAVVLTDEPRPRVLLARRNDNLKFMGGHYVFPGGRIDEKEDGERVRHAIDDSMARAVHAVARETFEEAGLLLADADPPGALPSREVLRAARTAMIREERTFDDILAEHGLHLDARRFVPAGDWVTPKGSPIRFHARYFLVRHPILGPDGTPREGEPFAEPHELLLGEMDRVEWLEPVEARRRWRAGETLLPPPVAYVLEQLVHRGSVEEALEPIRRTTHTRIDTPGRIEYRCGVSVLPLRAPALPPSDMTNCVVVGERELWVIDPGTPYADEKEALALQLDRMLELGARVAGVLLTHSHPDHVGAAEFVRDRYGAPIHAHPAVAAQVSFPIDRELAHDQTIAIPGDPDWRLRCLHTPGHDPGHLCFLEETTRTLVGGDIVAEKGTIVIPLEMGGDMDEYLASLRMLHDLEGFDLLLPAHGLHVSDPKRKFAQYIDHRLAREAKIKAAWDEGARTLDELVERAYDDTDPRAWPLAKMSLKAHLKRLGVEAG